MGTIKKENVPEGWSCVADLCFVIAPEDTTGWVMGKQNGECYCPKHAEKANK